MKRSALDIGSNTVRLLISERENDRWEKKLLLHRVTRLSGDFNGQLQPEAMKRTLDTVAEFAKAAKDASAWPIRASLTGVARKATNTKEFIQEVKGQCDVQPVVISGETEAKLTTLGAVAATGLLELPFTLFDIGGFSTEIIFVKNGHPVDLASFNLGVVRMVEDITMSVVPTSEQLKVMEKQTEKITLSMAKKADEIGFVSSRLVGTAGTATTLAAIAQDLETYDPLKVEKSIVTKSKIEQIYRELIQLNPMQRIERFPSLEKGREDVIIPGCLICMAMMDGFDHQEMMVTEGGLLEGLIEVEVFHE